MGYLVDSPGYGYANFNFDAQKFNQGMLLDYIKISTRLSGVYMLVHSEHGLKANDLVFLYKTFHHKMKINIVLTKCDKLDKEMVFDRMMAIGH